MHAASQCMQLRWYGRPTRVRHVHVRVHRAWKEVAPWRLELLRLYNTATTPPVELQRILNVAAPVLHLLTLAVIQHR